MFSDVIHEDHASPVAVARVDREYRLLATSIVRSGECLFRLKGDKVNRPSRYSVQIDRNVHLDLEGTHSETEVLDKYFWRFLNHSCEPNAVVRGLELIAIRPIQPWEEITFDYDTTEYDMAEPFDCHCGNLLCRGRIRGFKYLDSDERERLRPKLAPYLLRMLDNAEEPIRVPAHALAEGSAAA